MDLKRSWTRKRREGEEREKGKRGRRGGEDREEGQDKMVAVRKMEGHWHYHYKKMQEQV